MKVKAELLSLDPALRSRVFKAALEQTGMTSSFHLPIEDDAATIELIRAATSAAELLAGRLDGARPLPPYFV